jgi:hypothetical protein
MTKACWLLTAVVTASTAPTPGRVPRGNWGGDHARLIVTSKGGTVEFDCGHGSIDSALRADGGGRFATRGRYFREHGGPVRKDEAPDAVPARYSGSLRRGSLTMLVTLSNGEELGPFELRLGQRPRLMKCR